MKLASRIVEEIGAWMTVGVLVFAVVKIIQVIFKAVVINNSGKPNWIFRISLREKFMQ